MALMRWLTDSRRWATELGRGSLLATVSCMQACRAVVPSPPAVQEATSPARTSVTPPLAATPDARSTCRLALGDGSTASPGPAYILVQDVGVLRIDEGTARQVLQAKDIAYDAQMVVDDDGVMWIPGASPMSLWRVDADVQELDLTAGRGKDVTLHAPVVRSPSNVWVVTYETEWSVQHFDHKGGDDCPSTPRFGYSTSTATASC